MARMIRTIISFPEDEKTWLDDYSKRHRISSAQIVRVAVRDFREKATEDPAGETSAVREEQAAYGPPLPRDLADMDELKRRAAGAAGRFASGVPDLSVAHDRYLTGKRTAGKVRNRAKIKSGVDGRKEGKRGRAR